MPVDPNIVGGMMGGLGGAPKVGPPSAGPGEMGAEEDKEKGSITAVKDLLQQAMDMLSTLDTEGEGAEDMGTGPIGAPPAAPTRPPMNIRG